jgi:excisionase family DNA binding protein
LPRPLSEPSALSDKCTQQIMRQNTPMPKPALPVIPVTVLATRIGCSETTIRNAIKSGQLPAFKVGRRFMVIRAAADKFAKDWRATHKPKCDTRVPL